MIVERLPAYASTGLWSRTVFGMYVIAERFLLRLHFLGLKSKLYTHGISRRDLTVASERTGNTRTAPRHRHLLQGEVLKRRGSSRSNTPVGTNADWYPNMNIWSHVRGENN